MAKFNNKEFNPEVFEKYTKTIESTKELSLIKNAILQNVSKYGAKLSEQAGGNYIIEPVKGQQNGNKGNYDGATTISGTGRISYRQGKVAIGRWGAWTELDFSNDITSTSWLPEASEVMQFWDESKQSLLLTILKGMFASTINNFGTKHTYEVANKGSLGADTFTVASQAVLGDKKRKLEVSFMHSLPATNLESLKLLNYLKYTDAQGIERDLTIGQLNGKIVIIDDEMPVLNGYDASTSATTGALKVVASGATTGEVNLADVTGADFYPSGVKATDYVLEGTKYVTYIMERNFFEYEEVGVEVPSEVDRDAKTNGGQNTLISRKRFVIVPKNMSFTKASMSSDSPTDAELATGSNWAPVNDGAASNTKYIDDKLIPIVRIISRG